MIQLTVAWFNLTMPNQTVENDLKAKKIKLPQMIFFSQKTTNKIFMYLLAPFILQKFQAQNGPFALKNFFWYKPLFLLSSTYWPFSLRKT